MLSDRDTDGTGSLHRIVGIVQDVRKDLHQLSPVPRDRYHRVRVDLFDLDARRLLALDEGDRLLRHFDDIQMAGVRLVPSGEIEQAPDDPGRHLDLGGHPVETGEDQDDAYRRRTLSATSNTFARGVLISCATPAASWPTMASLSACAAWNSQLRCSERSTATPR